MCEFDVFQWIKHCIGTKIADNAVATEHITDLAVTTAKLAANAVTIPVFALWNKRSNTAQMQS